MILGNFGSAEVGFEERFERAGVVFQQPVSHASFERISRGFRQAEVVAFGVTTEDFLEQKPLLVWSHTSNDVNLDRQLEHKGGLVIRLIDIRKLTASY